MNTELVEIKRGEVVCDSQTVARKFNQKPARIKKLIKDVIEDLGVHECTPYFNPKYVIEDREYRGQEYTAYLMNRDFFSLLVMRFKGKNAVAWQIKYIARFNAMELQLKLQKDNAADPKWIGHRKLLTDGRKKETDVIKEFVEYATFQGSKKANFYYKQPYESVIRLKNDLGMILPNGCSEKVHFAMYECPICHKDFKARMGNVKNGSTTKCRSCATRILKTVHGKTGHRIFNIWQNMIQRCTNKNNPRFKDYGGRGICICEDWIKDFISFDKWAEISGYDDTLTIERKDNDGNYDPLNCEWITITEQSQNKRGGVYYDETKQKWIASKTFDEVKTYLGCFDSYEQATIVVDAFKDEYRDNESAYPALTLMTKTFPKLRDTMNLYEISELLLAERVAQSSLKKYMELKRDYHDIYESVKDDLITFANGLRLS